MTSGCRNINALTPLVPDYDEFQGMISISLLSPEPLWTVEAKGPPWPCLPSFTSWSPFQLLCWFSSISLSNESLSHDRSSEAVLCGNPKTSFIISIAFHWPPITLKIMELCKPLRLGNKGAKLSSIKYIYIYAHYIFRRVSGMQNWSKASRLGCWMYFAI